MGEVKQVEEYCCYKATVGEFLVKDVHLWIK